MCVRDPVTSRSCSAWVRTLFVVWGDQGESGEGRGGVRDPGRMLMPGAEGSRMDPSADLWSTARSVALPLPRALDPPLPPTSTTGPSRPSPRPSPAPSSPSVAPSPPPSPAYLQPVPSAVIAPPLSSPFPPQSPPPPPLLPQPTCSLSPMRVPMVLTRFMRASRSRNRSRAASEPASMPPTSACSIMCGGGEDGGIRSRSRCRPPLPASCAGGEYGRMGWLGVANQ